MDDQPTGLNRRTLIRATGLGAALLAVGAVGVELQSTAPLPVPDLAAFSPRAFRVLTAVADCVCPGFGPALPKASELGVPALIDAYVASLHPVDQRQTEQALLLLESPLAGALYGGGPRPFTRLSPEGRARRLAGWSTSRLSVLQKAWKALRNLVVTTYHTHPDAFAGLGYPGPPDYGQARAPAIQPRQLRDRPIVPQSPQTNPEAG